MSALESLRCERTFAAVRDLIEVRRWLAAEGARLSDALYEVIGGLADAAAKPFLVALRRAVFTGRRPGNREWSADLERVVPGEVAARVRAWIRRLEQRDDLAGRLPHLLDDELNSRRERLRAAVADEVFQYGLVHGSPVLFGQLRTWLAAGDVPDRQALLRLSKYLSRVVAKTSPYATFTMVGGAQWSEQGPAVEPLSPWIWRSVVELNGWLTQQAVSTVTRRPEFADTLRVRLNPSAVEDGSTVWFLGAAPGEPLTGLTLTGTLRACLDFLGCTPEPTVEMLRGHLHALDAGHHGRRAVDDYVNRMLETGLVELVPPVADQARDHLGVIVAWLREHQEAPASAPAAQAHRVFHELDVDLRAYPGLSRAEDRAARCDAIRRTLTDHADAVLGGSPLPRKNIIDENAVLTTPVLRCGWQHWRPALDDLAAVRHLAGLFARDLPVKLATAAAFTARYGAGAEVGFLDFYRALRQRQATGDSSLVDYLFALLGKHRARVSDSPVQTVRALEQLRRDTLTSLRSHPLDDRGVIAVDPHWVRRTASSWPGHVRPPGSIACHVQALPDPDGAVRLVLNGVAPGHGQSQARLRRLLDLAGGDDGAVAAAGDQPDPGLVEVRGVFNSNLNRRPAMVAYDLDYPFTVSDRPLDQRICLTDLVVSVDAALGLPRLHSRRDGAPLRPVHLGGMADTLLPPALRLLVAAWGDQPTPALPTWLLWDGPAAPAVDTVRRLPRVEIGRVTLARAGWYLRASELPLRHKGEPDAAFLLRFVTRWHELGIPERCFVRVLHQATGRKQGQQAAPGVGKDRKPLYLDIANWFSLTVFERAIQHPRDVVVVHEARPDLADAPRYGAAGQRVTEYVVEVPGRAW